jgi:hypothetical protein
LEIHYIVPFWVIVHACQLVDSESLVYDHGGLLIQTGPMVDLQWELQKANMSTNLVELSFTWNLLNNTKSVEN